MGGAILIPMSELLDHLRALATVTGRGLSELHTLVTLVAVWVGGLRVLLLTHPIAEPV